MSSGSDKYGGRKMFFGLFGLFRLYGGERRGLRKILMNFDLGDISLLIFSGDLNSLWDLLEDLEKDFITRTVRHGQQYEKLKHLHNLEVLLRYPEVIHLLRQNQDFCRGYTKNSFWDEETQKEFLGLMDELNEERGARNKLPHMETLKKWVISKITHFRHTLGGTPIYFDELVRRYKDNSLSLKNFSGDVISLLDLLRRIEKDFYDESFKLEQGYQDLWQLYDLEALLRYPDVIHWLRQNQDFCQEYTKDPFWDEETQKEFLSLMYRLNERQGVLSKRPHVKTLKKWVISKIIQSLTPQSVTLVTAAMVWSTHVAGDFLFPSLAMFLASEIENQSKLIEFTTDDCSKLNEETHCQDKEPTRNYELTSAEEAMDTSDIKKIMDLIQDLDEPVYYYSDDDY